MPLKESAKMAENNRSEEGKNENTGVYYGEGHERQSGREGSGREAEEGGEKRSPIKTGRERKITREGRRHCLLIPISSLCGVQVRMKKKEKGAAAFWHGICGSTMCML